MQTSSHAPQAQQGSPTQEAVSRSKRSQLQSSLSNPKAFVVTAVTMLALFAAVVAFPAAFRSDQSSARSLKLAEWTAVKDYLEACQQVSIVGLHGKDGCTDITP